MNDKLRKELLKWFNRLERHNITNILSDKLYLRISYYLRMGEKLNLADPKTFNEKIQWLKIYDRRSIYTTMVDKYEVKKYVAEKIGDQYIIPTYGVWDKLDDIDYDALPNQFVLKCTHDSGGLAICRDKTKFDFVDAKKKLQRSLDSNYYWHGREWPYKNVKPRIIAEKYLADESENELKDYKLMCFNGEVLCSLICTNRFSNDGIKKTFYDRNWNRLPFKRLCPSTEDEIDLPLNYAKMLEISEILSKDLTFLRTDFYEIDGRLYFGELTFYPESGMEKFEPEQWDYKLGSWIKLPGGGIH